MYLFTLGGKQTMDFRDILERYSLNEKILNNFNGKRVPHAIIIEGFSSEEDDIRLAIAKIISAFLMCKNENEKPCFNCNSCNKIFADNHPDVIKIGDNGLAKSFHIDKIRELRQDVFIIPNESNYKVYILDYSDNMTAAAQNALLKVLEEPPKSVMFILICKSSKNLIQTIKSRCQIFSFEINENKMYDKKTEDCVKDIINGLVAVTEWELMLATSKLIKDKLLLKNVLDILIDIFSEAVRESFEASSSNKIFAEESKILSARLTKLSLIRSIEVLENTKDMLEKNANMNLLISTMCANMRSCSVI